MNALANTAPLAANDQDELHAAAVVSQYVFTGEVSFAKAKAGGMVRCPECSQHKCSTPTVIRNFPRLRWCGNYTEGAKPVWDKQKRVFVYSAYKPNGGKNA